MLETTVSLKFEDCLLLKKEADKIIADFDNLNWRFIKKIGKSLFEHVKNLGYVQKEELKPYLSIRGEKLESGVHFTIINFEKDSLIQAIEDFLVKINSKNYNTPDLFLGDETNEVIEEFLASFSGKTIRNPLIVNFLDRQYKLYGKFSSIPAKLPILEKNIEVVARISELGFDGRQLEIVTTDLNKISEITYDIIDFFHPLCAFFEAQTYIRVILTQKLSAKQIPLWVLHDIKKI